ncbi:sulfotransferase domain-containing protein [Candidatus Poribacteria bacterium]|nr:sulfotransferase domain-containing protein [Candidatus Poribacteria bacterium]
MSEDHPQVVHEYRNWTLDSTRWERFRPRDDDIVIATPYKSGTTWMQLIVGSLIFPDRSIHDVLAERPLSHITPWIDLPHAPLDGVIDGLEAQAHRRFVKTHLPLDGLVYYPGVRYIVMHRDARDVFMSLWNHHASYREGIVEAFSVPGADDIHTFWREWTTRGWFPWESEGYPYWSNLRHSQTWWDYRRLPNILFVHFNRLLEDLRGEILRVAAFLGIPISAEDAGRIAHEVTFSTVKEKADTSFSGMGGMFVGGAQTFFYKATNGRWKAALSEAELVLYEAAAERELTPECRRWLESAVYPSRPD